MGIPLTLFVGIYALGVLFILIMAGINIYHIIATGTIDLVSFAVSASIVILMVIIIAFTGIYLSGTDTSQVMYLFGSSTGAPAF